MEYLDLNLLLVGLIVWAAMTYNRKRKARWKKLRQLEADLHAQNLRYYLNVYCGRQSEKDKLISQPVSLS